MKNDNTVRSILGFVLCAITCQVSAGCKPQPPAEDDDGGEGDDAGEQGHDTGGIPFSCGACMHDHPPYNDLPKEVGRVCICKTGTGPNDFIGGWHCGFSGIEAFEESEKDRCEMALQHEPSYSEFYCGPPDCDTEPTTGESTTNCTGWDPGAQITLVSGVYYVDAFLVTDLINDPAPILACDDATIDELVGGSGFEIANADNGEMLYELGLRDGDLPISLNGYSLSTYLDAWIAFMELWVADGETEYTLIISRNSSPVTLYYEVFFTSP